VAHPNLSSSCHGHPKLITGNIYAQQCDTTKQYQPFLLPIDVSTTHSLVEQIVGVIYSTHTHVTAIEFWKRIYNRWQCALLAECRTRLFSFRPNWSKCAPWHFKWVAVTSAWDVLRLW